MVPYKLRHQNGCPGLFLRPPLFFVDIMCGVLTTAEIADRLSDGAAAVLADNDSGRGELRMADIMIAALDGSTPFDAESLAQTARTTWPDASWPGSPEQVPIADSHIVVTDWTNDVVTLRPNMTRDEVYALRA
jgi:dihydroorotase-like cyclic amidohydrolase